MKRIIAVAPLLLLVIAAPAFGQKKLNALRVVEENPNLPRVLILGDSISIGYTEDVRQLLDGVANVQRAQQNCGATTRGLENIDKWIGEKPWDVIHFNFGLHDLKYCDEKGVLVDIADGNQQVPIDDYRANLETIVERLKKTDAKLIFATTTPVPKGVTGRVPGDEIPYNKAAVDVMKKHGVAIDDLYTFALPVLDEIQLEVNVHFKPEGSKKLGEEVARHIREALKK